MPHYSKFILLILVSLFCGCGLLWDSSEEAPPIASGGGNNDQLKNEGAEVAVKPLRLPDGKELSDIEIILEAPLEPIDGFIIKYGSAPDALDKIKRVELTELQKVSGGDKNPPRYRFLLRAIPNNQKVFFTVASFRGSFYSSESKAVEVK